VDHEISRRLFIGGETADREIERTLFYPFDPVTSTIDIMNRERTSSAYLYWAATDEISFSARYERGRYTNTPNDLFGYTDMHLERTPLELRYFAPMGLTAGLRATHVDEHGLFVQGLPPALAPGEDRFWTYDAFVGYRLPNRRGMLSLNADNLLDERFQFQDPNPENLSIMPERVVSLRFTLAFD
jgi:hypothetical protein